MCVFVVYRKQAAKQTVQQVKALEEQIRKARERLKKLPKTDTQGRQVCL